MPFEERLFILMTFYQNIVFVVERMTMAINYYLVCLLYYGEFG